MADSAVERIDHYRLFEKIGAGGMGEVYRAVDERLGRTVAVKLLPQADAAITRRQVRLVREAQAAGHLNHPGIVTVHDVGRHDDRSYVVMELVDGRPLRELCGRTDPAGAVALCAQAAEALAAAHARGILHRDIKPDNMMVTADRRLKILDFGLAKLRAAADEDLLLPAPALAAFVPTPLPAERAEKRAEKRAERDPGTESTVTASGGDLAIGSRYMSPSLTHPGALLGTPAYMSPEQAARGTFDERSEVYSLGLVLYELVSGQRALDRDTLDRTIEAAMAADIPPVRIADGRRPHRGLVRLLDRALAREPEQRFADMNEMAAALRALEKQMATRVRWRWVAAGLAIAAAAGGGLTALRAARTPPSEPAAPAAVAVTGNRRLTLDAGCESAPSFTRDGRSVLFSGVIDGDMEIVELDLAAGTRRRLTTMPGWDLGATQSPDGRRIAFVHFGARGRELHLLDGDRTRFVGAVVGNPAWSPSGELLFGDEAGAVQRLDIDRQHRSELARLPRRMVIGELRAFPDGAVAFQARVPGPDQALLQLGIIETDGRIRLLDPAPTAAAEAGLTIDATGRGMYYAVSTPGGVEQLVWRDRSGGEPMPLPGLPVSTSGVDASPDGSRMVLSTCREQRIGARLRAGAPIEPLEERRELSMINLVALDRQRIFFASDRAGRSQIWQLESGQAPRVVVETDSDQPTVSTTHLAWVGRATGQPGIFARPLDGGSHIRLTDGPRDVQPIFSRDGRTVYFLRVGGEPGTRGHAVPLAGGEATPVTPSGIAELAVSPVADLLAYVPAEAGRAALMVGPPGGPFEPRVLPPGSYWGPWFSRDGARLLVVRGANEVVEVPVAGGDAKVVWSYGTGGVWHVEEDPAGGGWLAALAVYEGDLILLDGRFR